MNKLASSIEKNYEIIRELGKGGMGTVYFAIDKRLDRPVAIKILDASSDSSIKEETIQRFQREAKAVARLSHKNIVNIHDLGDEGDIYYMVMEFVEGVDLSVLLREKGIIPTNLVISIGIQICKALAYAHDNNIIHRDIKPANIILSKKGLAKLTDFGVAQLTKEEAKLTQTGAILGSIMYIPPEQLKNSATVDYRADIYSLGATLYELFTGQVLFNADSVTELFMKILSTEPEPATAFSQDIPEALNLVLKKALMKDPKDRYSSALEFGKALEMFLDPNSLFEGNFLDKPSNITINTINTAFSFDDKTAPLNNTLSSKIPTNTILKKTLVDKTIISSLAKNFSWMKKIINPWKTEQITRLNFEQVINKVTEPSLFGKAFTGVLIVNKTIYTFIEDGYFIGAIDLEKNLVGESVFDNLPTNPQTLELKIPDTEELSIPTILACISENSGEIVQNSIDSSLVNIELLIDSLSNPENPFTGYLICYKQEDILYYGFYKGKKTFSISSREAMDSELDLKTVILKGSLIFNSYLPKPKVMGPSIKKLLKNTPVLLKYRDEKLAKLYDIVALDNKEVPIHIIKESKQNTYLELETEHSSKITLLDNELDTEQIIKNSLHYQLSEWFFREYFYLLNSSGNIVSLKYIYSWFPATEKISFFETLVGEDGKNYDFSMVLKGQVKDENYKKVLMLIRFGDGTRENVAKFIEDTIQVKKKLIKSGDIGGAIYVSQNEYTSDALKLFYESTVEQRKGFGLGSLDKLTKYKGFVRIGFGRGFHLNLLEYNAEHHTFNMIAPLLK